jgi:hypothetical protein
MKLSIFRLATLVLWASLLLSPGGVTDSTTVTKPAVHAVRVANHVNPKLQLLVANDDNYEVAANLAA